MQIKDTLKEKIKPKCQQGSILIVPAISGHQQQEQDYHQVSGVKILRQKLFQKISRRDGCILLAGMGLSSFGGTGLPCCWLPGRWWGRGACFWRLLDRGRLLFWMLYGSVGYLAAAVAAVGLWDISVIHSITCLSEAENHRN